MCGITGIVMLNGQDASRQTLMEMTAHIRHRGPDDHGFYMEKCAGLGHARLTIIDLSSDARQPMGNEDGTLFITYNGETYNYVELRRQLIDRGHIFRSKSDSEVVLHAFEEWKQGCLERLRGMWAFAIWDVSGRRLFCARDRIGIKPFYYVYEPEKYFIFASELKALLRYPGMTPRLQERSMFEYLYLGYTLGEKTWIKGIKKLLPGQYLILDEKGLSIKKYWNVLFAPDYCMKEDAAASELRALIERSVDFLMRSDVEVGAHLSGGIDSSTVSILASKRSPGALKVFSGKFSEPGGFDESHFIDMVTGAHNMRPNVITISRDNFQESLSRIIWHLDEPVAGPGAYPQYFLSKFIHECGIKVVLGGQGGDELFGGYPFYNSGLLLSLLKTACSRRAMGFKGYIALKDIVFNYAPKFLRTFIGRVMSAREQKIRSMLNRDLAAEMDTGSFMGELSGQVGSLEKMQVWDLENYLPALLQVEDRLGMAFSIETRFPLLDHEVVEFAARLPSYLKMNRHGSKYLLRQSMKDLLPAEILLRQDKKGFPTPMKLWLNDSVMRNFAQDIIGRKKGIFKDCSVSWEKLNICVWMDAFEVGL